MRNDGNAAKNTSSRIIWFRRASWPVFGGTILLLGKPSPKKFYAAVIKRDKSSVS